MKQDQLIKLIHENARKINALRDEINQLVKKTSEKEEYYNMWQAASDRFNDSWDSLAFPGGLSKGMELLKKNDPSTIALAITYLKADPYYFRSGYIKEFILRSLKKAPLTTKQVIELQDILIDVIHRHGRRENREYYRLGVKIADDVFRERIQQLIKQTNDPEIKKKALNFLNPKKKNPNTDI